MLAARLRLTAEPFVWKKYNTAQEQDGYVMNEGSHESHASEGASTSGYPSYNFNYSTGVFTMAGTIETVTSGTVYNGSGSSMIETVINSETVTSTTYSATPAYATVQGSYIGTVSSSEPNTYPTNGAQGGYWYVKQ